MEDRLEKLVQQLKEKKEKEKEKKKEKREKEKAKEKEERKEKREKALEKYRNNKRRIAHKKSLRRRQNRRAYVKRMKPLWDERKRNQDEMGYYRLILFVNRKKEEVIYSKSTWRTDAYTDFEERIKENRKFVKFPIKSSRMGRKEERHEILLLKRVGEEGEAEKYMSGEMGKRELVTTDSQYYAVEMRDEWFVEDTLHVYGFHPVNDRKEYGFVLNEVLLKGLEDPYETKQVLVIKSAVMIRYSTDFDLVVCKNNGDAERLYDTLEEDVEKMNLKNVFFTGKVRARGTAKSLYEEIRKKTGWPLGVLYP